MTALRVAALCLVISCFAGASLGQEVFCCTENQWQGRAQGNAFWNTSTGDFSNEFFFEYIYYSYPAAARVDAFVDINHENYNGTIIYRYDEGTAWYLQPSGGCYWTKIGTQMPRACATSLGLLHASSITLGAQMPCTIYQYKSVISGVNLFDTIIMAHHDQRSCVPVEGKFFDHQKSGFILGSRYTYYNIVESIPDPMIFNHPAASFCTEESPSAFALLTGRH